MTISVVTPSFRNSKWLKLCIASVADQEVEVEHIIQDANSDDGTLDWLLVEDRVKAFVEADQGMYDAINRGLHKAQGEILAYLNCDEQYLPGALKIALKFFRDYPQIDMVFGDAVIVDPAGAYLWHRKVLVPQISHTAVCPLSILTCATFFRRRLIDDYNLFFDTHWRIIGDSEWMLRVLRANIRMGTLRQFTSAFTHTGDNLSLQEPARKETLALHGRAPWWHRRLRRGVVLYHRLRRLFNGIYFQKPFSFSIYTQSSPKQRVTHHVAHPSFRWRW